VPTYQYACTECGHTFEQVQSFADDALEVCPVCNGRLRKVFNAVGVVFKGSGFYRTDSRASTTTATSTPAGESTSTPSTPASTPAASSSDAKPRGKHGHKHGHKSSHKPKSSDS
jgi:putative FmdB family regulatory protein